MSQENYLLKLIKLLNGVIHWVLSFLCTYKMKCESFPALQLVISYFN